MLRTCRSMCREENDRTHQMLVLVALVAIVNYRLHLSVHLLHKHNACPGWSIGQNGGFGLAIPVVLSSRKDNVFWIFWVGIIILLINVVESSSIWSNFTMQRYRHPTLKVKKKKSPRQINLTSYSTTYYCHSYTVRSLLTINFAGG